MPGTHRKLTVIIDPEHTEVLYINGWLWAKHSGGVDQANTVFACEIAEAAGGRAVFVDYQHTDEVMDSWPEELSDIELS